MSQDNNFPIGGGSANQIGPSSALTFRNAMLISTIGVGGLSCLIFHVIVKPTDTLSIKVIQNIWNVAND